MHVVLSSLRTARPAGCRNLTISKCVSFDKNYLPFIWITSLQNNKLRFVLASICYCFSGFPAAQYASVCPMIVFELGICECLCFSSVSILSESLRRDPMWTHSRLLSWPYRGLSEPQPLHESIFLFCCGNKECTRKALLATASLKRFRDTITYH